MRSRRWWRGLSALLLAGCAATVPARLQAPAPDCLAQIEAFATQQTGRAVRLGEGSFAQSDRLQLQTQTLRDAKGRPRDGRDPGRPETFRLFDVAGACTVEHLRSGVRARVDACRCTALSR